MQDIYPLNSSFYTQYQPTLIKP